jgi:hypothetical protein
MLTFLLQGDRDELITWHQSCDTIVALVAQLVEAGFATPSEAGHAFFHQTAEAPSRQGELLFRRHTILYAATSPLKQ